jgi:MFS family permease
MERTTRNMILAVTTLSGFIATFAASSVNLALPSIGEYFQASAVILAWIVLAFVMAAGAVIMPVGRAADFLGHMRVFLLGMAAFTVLSFASAAAPSVGALVAIRALHGLAAALLFATNIALVTLSQPPEARGRALGILTAGVYLGTTVGPLLGGIITEHLGWRSLFLFVGGLSLVNSVPAAWKLYRVDWKEPKRRPFDLRGSATWAVSFPALLMGLTFLPSLVGILLVATGSLGLALFVWWETNAADPILNVDLLRRNRVFALGNIASLANYTAVFAWHFFMSLYLQFNRGLRADTAAYVLVGGVFLQSLISPVAGRLADRLQPRLIAATGVTLSALGLLGLAFLGEKTPYWYIIPALCLVGIGFGLFASPITHTIMGSVEKRYVGTASATIATMRVAGQSLSMGIAGLILAVLVGRHEIDKASPSDLSNLLSSVRVGFGIFTGICVLALAAVLLARRRGDPR